ncbi:MAG: monovalent cation:proton antiporter-2 (CPA2) family protein [Methylococcaceae bacterium]|nr:monovalent cation:proton antiporter-2 (CPA2) family protein [Methylococcaceae bacterium]
MTETGSNYLIDILAILLATVTVVPVFHAIRLGAILGYLTAGVILGPWALSIITEVDEIRHLAEFGVIFLLFVLGIELKPEKLWQMRKLVLGLGSGQLLITAAIFFSISIWLGVSINESIIIGFGLALSSTAFCLNLLAERGGISTTMGRMSFSVLLFQDLAVVPLLALVSMFSGGEVYATELGLNLFYAISAIIILLLVGRYLLNPILGKIVASQDPEVFIAVAVLLVLGVAWIMEYIGLSMALGAFLAGLMLAESHYRHQIEADILPFRGILLGLFFMTVGMSIDFDLFLKKYDFIIYLTLLLMIIKASVIYLLIRFSGASHNNATQASVLLSQSGEFGFVMFGFASTSGVLEPNTSQILTLIITLSMVFTPFVVKISNILLTKFHKPELPNEDCCDEWDDVAQEHIILAGFGRVGARIGAILSTADVPYIAIEMSQERVKAAQAQGFPVFYGDASNIKVLRAAGASHAKMIVVVLDDAKKIDRMIPLMRQYYPDLPIHARAIDRQHCADLISQGVTSTVSETLEISLRLTEEILLGSGINQANAKKAITEFRNDYYEDVVQKVTDHKVVMGELKH